MVMTWFINDGDSSKCSNGENHHEDDISIVFIDFFMVHFISSWFIMWNRMNGKQQPARTSHIYWWGFSDFPDSFFPRMATINGIPILVQESGKPYNLTTTRYECVSSAGLHAAAKFSRFFLCSEDFEKNTSSKWLESMSLCFFFPQFLTTTNHQKTRQPSTRHPAIGSPPSPPA